MPQTVLYDRTGATIGNVELSESLFGAPINAAVLHQVVLAQLAGRHLGTHDTKTRGEVAGAPGHVQGVVAGTQAGQRQGEVLPEPMRAERHQIVHDIVPVSDTLKYRAHA